MIRRLLGRSLAACLLVGQTVAPGALTSSPRLFDVTTAHGVFGGAPVDPSDVFTSDERTIYVWFRCEGCSIGTVITSSWLYVERDPPLEFGVASVVVNSEEDFGEFHYELRRGVRWSTGAYRIDLLIDGVVLTQVRYIIAIPAH
jgi:hypothetical protein